MKLAAIDIGSNSIHMVIAEADIDGLEIIDREKEMVKLGAGVFQTHMLSERAFADGLNTIRKYVKLADSHNVDEIIAVATSATREAQNGGRFLDTIVQDTGIEPRIIPGTEESQLIFIAVQNALNLQSENTLIIDIGGGSVEFAIGNNRDFLFGESVKLGVQRLLDFVTHDGILSKDALNILRNHVKISIRNILPRIREIGFSRIVGTSGTIRTLGEATLKLAGRENIFSVNAEKIDTKNLSKLVTKLLKLPPEQRTKFSPIGIERTDTIHLGGVLLVEILKQLKATELTLCDASLREGVLIDYIKRHPRMDIFPDVANVKHRSIVQLARKYRRSGRRENHIAVLALQLFDQTIPLHSFSNYERQLLYNAALLHSVGKYINFKSYHKHSQYVISNAQLRGFTDEEVTLMGAIVRFHRKSTLKNKAEEAQELNKLQRKQVMILSAILRIAVGLDRGHIQSVKELQCEILDKNLQIKVSGSGDLELELWGARRLTEPLERALDVSISISRVKAE